MQSRTRGLLTSQSASSSASHARRSRQSQPQLSGGALTPTSAHLAELESLLTRMEAVV